MSRRSPVSDRGRIRVALNVLATWPALDHYGARPGVTYSGVWGDDSGHRPAWPAGEGPKVFLYLKPFAALPSLLHLLERSRLPVLSYMPEIDPQIRGRMAWDRISVVEEPAAWNRPQG